MNWKSKRAFTILYLILKVEYIGLIKGTKEIL